MTDKTGGMTHQFIPNELKVFVYGMGLATIFSMMAVMSAAIWRIAFEPSHLMCVSDALSARDSQ